MSFAELNRKLLFTHVGITTSSSLANTQRERQRLLLNPGQTVLFMFLSWKHRNSQIDGLSLMAHWASTLRRRPSAVNQPTERFLMQMNLLLSRRASTWLPQLSATCIMYVIDRLPFIWVQLLKWDVNSVRSGVGIITLLNDYKRFMVGLFQHQHHGIDIIHLQLNIIIAVMTVCCSAGVRY